MTVQEAFDKFIRSRLREGCSEKTIESYNNLTYPLRSYLGPIFEMENLRQGMIDDFIGSLYDRKNLSRSTLASYIRNASIFLRWCQQGRNLLYDASLIRVPKTPKKILRLYSPEDIQLIFDTVEVSPEWLIARNKAMIALMLDSGLRQSEVAGLTMENLDFERKRLKVTGKGAKDRYVPLGRFSADMLRKYLSVRPYNLPVVFLSVHGQPISCGAIKSMTGDMQKRLPFEFSSHKLRHNFATNYLVDQYYQYGHMDVYQLMSIMGHEDISTTKRYLHEAQSIVAASSSISHLDKLFA